MSLGDDRELARGWRNGDRAAFRHLAKHAHDVPKVGECRAGGPNLDSRPSAVPAGERDHVSLAAILTGECFDAPDQAYVGEGDVGGHGIPHEFRRDAKAG